MSVQSQCLYTAQGELRCGGGGGGGGGASLSRPAAVEDFRAPPPPPCTQQLMRDACQNLSKMNTGVERGDPRATGVISTAAMPVFAKNDYSKQGSYQHRGRSWPFKLNRVLAKGPGTFVAHPDARNPSGVAGSCTVTVVPMVQRAANPWQVTPGNLPGVPNEVKVTVDAKCSSRVGSTNMWDWANARLA